MNLDDTVQQSMVLNIIKKALVVGFTFGALFSYPLSLWSVIRRIESIIIQRSLRKPRIVASINDEEVGEDDDDATPLIHPSDGYTIRDYGTEENQKCCSILNIKRNLVRIGLVSGTEILAVGVPSFTIAIAFIGSTFGIALMLIVSNGRII